MTPEEQPTPPAKTFNTKAKKPRLDPTAVQRQASDPYASAWVTASAGTGKTKVLTDRVLRLMLSGATAEEILCITFTRAAATLMTSRIRDELSLWATCDDKTLQGRLQKLQGRKATDAELTRARSLLPGFLDAAGGMGIQTIHAFSQSLIRRFPVESGVPPYFDVMDDQTAAELLRESQADILRRIEHEDNSPLAQAVRMITPEVSEDDFAELIGSLTYRRGQLLKIIHDKGGLEKTVDDIYAWNNAPRGLESKELRAMIASDQGLGGNAPDLAALNSAAETLAGGTATDLEKAKMIKAWLLHPEQRDDLFWDYVSVFLTTAGERRKKMTTKKTAAAEDAMQKEADRLMDGIEKIAAMNVARGTESLLRLTTAILDTYKDRKRALNLLDYDDLVWHANLMMREDNAAAWVIQKLPGNLRHVLIDEAQDTNPDQWELVSSVVQEFFRETRAKRQRKGPLQRTLFVVGDEKQSIFSFQRAEPREFARRKKMFSELVQKSGGIWREVEMDIAFRSTPAVTEAVDAVFSFADAADGLHAHEGGDQEEHKISHTPFRRGQAGLVELHPVIRGQGKSDPGPWQMPTKMIEVSNTTAQLADQIALKIRNWLDNDEMLPSRKRAISPGDIMILVRRRSDFVDDMARALKKYDVPVAGVDRMTLSDHIAVMDMVALGETLLFPRDDYKLACVLRSPLIGMSEAELESLATERTGTLRDALQEKAAKAKDQDDIFAQAEKYLSRLEQEFNLECPYEFYSSVLMNDAAKPGQSGLHAIYARLGYEAEDPLVEFLNALEKYEKLHPPSLQGFIAWLAAGEAEVKREVAPDRDNPRVRIMTVHSAKGLEAPVVILPDTTGVPADNARTRPRFLWPTDTRDVPLWVPRADLESTAFKNERLKAEDERDREYRRLLYVAMTRAADRLYVFGSSAERDTPDGSWYSLIERGLRQGLGDKLRIIPANDDATAAPVIRHESLQTNKPEPDGEKNFNRVKTAGVPAWARKPPAVQTEKLGRFRPSDYKADKEGISTVSPLESQKERYDSSLGVAIHQLFEFLPALPNEEREEAARQHLAKPSFGISKEDQQAAWENTARVLNDPEFGPLFGPNSRPEVSISGLLTRDGETKVMSGQIDRLVVDEKTVTIIDFKNSRKVPRTVDDVQLKYIVQMAIYRMALKQIYPDKEIRCALLWTRQAKLMPIPDNKMDENLERIVVSPSAAPAATKAKARKPAR